MIRCNWIPIGKGKGYPTSLVLILIDCPQKRGVEIALWRNGRWIVEDYSRDKFHYWTLEEAGYYTYIPPFPKKRNEMQKVSYIDAKAIVAEAIPKITTSSEYAIWWREEGKHKGLPSKISAHYKERGEWEGWDSFLDRK